MEHIYNNPNLKRIADRVEHYARNVYKRTLPEMKFIVLNNSEFMSLLSKGVYPTSPVNIWEGKENAKKKWEDESGQNSSIYYEVVQTGSPSYAYLNYTNSDMMQASVMAHVVGHCEFSELNVLNDSDPDRTEYVMWLTKKINRHIPKMGFDAYMSYWNWCASAIPLIAPNSQYNLDNSVVTHQTRSATVAEKQNMVAERKTNLFSAVDNTLLSLLPIDEKEVIKKDYDDKEKSEQIDRKGYHLKAPCQDILGFLRDHAPKSKGEWYILEYLYQKHRNTDFVMRTQIMNEGWAMYWEKKIMLDLFKEKTVGDVIAYAKCFSGVCYPRPWFQRNPYHLGYNLWNHIEEQFKTGKITLDYVNEEDSEKKNNWNKETDVNPMERMEEIVKTCTDSEFLRRYLTPDLVEKFHLNRLTHRMAEQIGLKQEDVYKQNKYYVWVDPVPVKAEMMKFFVDFGRPQLYVIDSDYRDGGILIYHRHKGRDLKKSWIESTLKNLTHIWKSPAHLLTNNELYSTTNTSVEKKEVSPVEFDLIKERMLNNQKPFNER